MANSDRNYGSIDVSNAITLLGFVERRDCPDLSFHDCPGPPFRDCPDSSFGTGLSDTLTATGNYSSFSVVVRWRRSGPRKPRAPLEVWGRSGWFTSVLSLPSPLGLGRGYCLLWGRSRVKATEVS